MKESDVLYAEYPDGSIHRISVDLARSVRRWAMLRYGRVGIDASALSQLYRSGTSVGANIREAQFAESGKDFVHKLKVAEKELGEFFYWLGLIDTSFRVSEDEATKSIVDLAQQVRRLLIAIIVKAKRNLQASP